MDATAPEQPAEQEHPGLTLYKGIEFPVCVTIVVLAATQEVKRYEIQDKHDNTLFSTKDAKEAEQLNQLLNFLHIHVQTLQNTTTEAINRLNDVNNAVAGKVERKKTVEKKKDA